MHKKTVLFLAAVFCVSLASLTNGRETGQDKAALVAAAKIRAEQQAQLEAETARLLAQINQLPPNERKAALILALKNSNVLQNARESETDKGNAASNARSEQGEKNNEIIAKVNQLPVIARHQALRQAMKDMKGKQRDQAAKHGSAPVEK